MSNPPLPGMEAPSNNPAGYMRTWQIGTYPVKPDRPYPWWLSDGNPFPDGHDGKPGVDFCAICCFATEVGARYWMQQCQRASAEHADHKAYNKAISKLLDKMNCDD